MMMMPVQVEGLDGIPEPLLPDVALGAEELAMMVEEEEMEDEPQETVRRNHSLILSLFFPLFVRDPLSSIIHYVIRRYVDSLPVIVSLDRWRRCPWTGRDPTTQRGPH
jgi:hypothetical protein